ncbi:MAG: EpsG family protein [Lysobacter sp.]
MTIHSGTGSATASSTALSARWGLAILLLVAVAAFGCWLVGMRSLEIGTDTPVYAGFFERLGHGDSQTRLEPGFVAVSYLLSKLGLGVNGYQAALFGLMLITVWISTRKYFSYLGDTRGYLTFLSASMMLLFLSPMFVNASINAIRQGLAALLVFTALLSFHQRQWWQFAWYGALATSLHYSSLLYLAFAPALFLNTKALRYAGAVGLLVYCSGLSQLIVQTLTPGIHAVVMEYAARTELRAGTRIDFAVFSAFWYVLPHLLAPALRPPYRERILHSTAVYLVMLLPFFAIGWGYFSNRYLLPAWLAVSLILAAVVCHNRLQALSHPLLIRLGLIASCAVFYWYVTTETVI